MEILLTSGIRANELIEYGKKCGHDFYVVRNRKDSNTYPGLELHSYDDWRSILEFIQQKEIDSVISICGNTPEQIALIRDGMLKYYLNESLQIPMIGHPLHSAMIGVDKGVMRQVLETDDRVTIANGAVARNKEQASQIASQIGYPVMLKDPAGSAGAKTAFCVTSKEVGRYFDMYDLPRVLLEKHVNGIEISIEALSYQGITVPLLPIYKGSTNSGEGHPTERLKMAPYFLSESRSLELTNLIQHLGKLFQWEGISDIDLVIPEQGPIVVLEVNTRFGGSTVLTNLTQAVNTYHQLVDMAMKQWVPPTIQPKQISLQIPVLQHFSLQQSQQLLFEFQTVKRVANKILPSRVKSILYMAGPFHQIVQDFERLASLISIQDAWKEFNELLNGSNDNYQKLRG